MADPSAAAQCADLVRRNDYDRYLLSLFAPPQTRARLLALYAFNHEVAKVRETVSEPLLGRIRLQWWREAIAEIYAGRAPDHPVARALLDAVRAGSVQALTRDYFDRILDGRDFDLESRAPADLVELEGYAEATSAALLWLAAEALGAPDQRTRAALTPLGIAWSLLGLARAIPHHARQRRQYLPAEIAAEAGLSAQDLFAPKPCPALARAVARLVETAQRRLAEAEAGAVAAAARPLLLYGTLARAQAERLRRCHFDVTRAASDVPSWRKIALLWWAARRL